MTYLVIYLISCLRSAGTKYLYIAQKHVHVCLMHVLNAKFVTQKEPKFNGLFSMQLPSHKKY